MAHTAKAAYAAALIELQRALPIIAEDGVIRDEKGAVQYRYALWEDTNEAIRPVLAAHGFALSFRTGRDGQQISVILVDPHDPNRVFVAMVGHPYGPNAERGVFRSLDGGLTWAPSDAATNLSIIDINCVPGSLRCFAVGWVGPINYYENTVFAYDSATDAWSRTPIPVTLQSIGCGGSAAGYTCFAFGTEIPSSGPLVLTAWEYSTAAPAWIGRPACRNSPPSAPPRAPSPSIVTSTTPTAPSALA